MIESDKFAKFPADQIRQSDIRHKQMNIVAIAGANTHRLPAVTGLDCSIVLTAENTDQQLSQDLVIFRNKNDLFVRSPQSSPELSDRRSQRCPCRENNVRLHMPSSFF
jgi:hypothetical protein